MRSFLILLFLIFIILVSGCVEQDSLLVGPSSDGVVIKYFSFDSSNVYVDDPVGLNLEVQNVGEEKANILSATLFGPDWATGPPLRSITGELLPSNPELDFEGEARSTRWILNAPDVTAETTYTVGTRVVYGYGTDYTGTLRVVTNSYLETLPEGERRSLLESGGIVSSRVTGGPLSVKPMKGRNFIVSDGGATISVVFELNNVGSGYPSSSSTINKDTMYRVEILSDDCRSPDDGTTVRLSKGKKRLFSCSFGISEGIVNKEDIIFSISFDYYYYVDGTTSISVAPLPGVTITTLG